MKLRKGNDYLFHLKDVLSNQPQLTIQEIMKPNKKASSYLFPEAMNDVDNLPSLGNVLIISGDEASFVNEMNDTSMVAKAGLCANMLPSR